MEENVQNRLTVLLVYLEALTRTRATHAVAMTMSTVVAGRNMDLVVTEVREVMEVLEATGTRGMEGDTRSSDVDVQPVVVGW